MAGLLWRAFSKTANVLPVEPVRYLLCFQLRRSASGILQLRKVQVCCECYVCLFVHNVSTVPKLPEENPADATDPNS
jgi:hypothetical protein